MDKCAILVFVLVFSSASLIVAVKPTGATAAENSWETIASMPTARTPSLAALNGKIYAIGGQTISGATAVNEVYDVATNTWTTVKPMLEADSGFATSVYEDKIYCFGWGRNQVYDPVADAWELHTPDPTPRSTSSASVVNGKMYIIGGFDSFFLSTPIRSRINEMYDPVADSWTTMAPLPIATAYCISAVVDNRIYVFGNDGEGGKSVQVYDPQTNTWSYGPPMPYSMYYETGIATTGVYAPKRIYLIGGLGAGFTQIFDPTTQSWSTGAEMPTPRRFLSVAVVDDLLYSVGGEDNEGYGTSLSNANERYTPLGYNPVPPAVQVISPEQSKTYTSSNVSLSFTVNRLSTKLSYSLNRETNATIAGNTTLIGLTNGVHNVTIYASDSSGNVGASQIVIFNVAQETQQQDPEPFPIALVITASGGSLAAVAAGLLVYFKKRKR